MKREGSAVWSGSLQEGRGTVSTGSGILDGQRYGFKTRFEDEPGTNPEELVAAAHASCFAMALSMILGERDLEAGEIRAKATVSLEREGDGFAVKSSHLDVEADVPGADQDAFLEAANAAKSGCPISKLLNANITMDARLTN